MTSNPLDFPLVTNNTVPVQFTAYYKPTARFVPPVPVNITGFIIKWQAFAPGSSIPVITKSTGAGSIVITNPTQGTFIVMVNAADTVNLAEGDYLHEAVTTDLSGSPVTITNNDPVLTAGTMFLRKQLTVQ
jgi:hypothetical protein